MRGFGHRIGDSVSVPGRGLRRMLVVVVVLTLAAGVGLGTALSVPTLARAVGLPADVATDDPPEPVRPVARLTATTPDPAAPTPRGVEAALAGGAAGLGSLTGTVVDPATGQALWNRQPQTAQTPASVTKLLTGAAALLTLDPTTRLTTTVTAGPTPDSVVLIGGGDPTLTTLPAGTDGMYPGAAHLDDLAAQVRAARPGNPPRTVYLDLGRYAGDTLAPGWDPADIAGGDIAPIVPVMLDGGRTDPRALDSPRTSNPGGVVARELGARLGTPDPAVQIGPAPAGARTLGAVDSAPMNELVRAALQNSDNVLAEALGREVARAAGAPASFPGAAGSVVRVLTERGVPTAGVTLSDTSGLSTADRLPAATLAGILTPAAAPDTRDPRTAALRPLLDGLPVAGGGGTLADRYGPGDPSGPGRGWVRAKTGTLTGTNSLAGVVSATDGRVLVFAWMSNGVEPLTARPRLDALAASLRACGCM